MNRATLPSSSEPFAHPLDALLADIAINLQLPRGLHAEAATRYAAIRRWIERPGSPLEGKIRHFYSQGSMAIDATISTRGTDDEYDLDVVAQLTFNQAPEPHEPLDLLEWALEGYPVEKGITRQTRCVTLNYADGMHVDVTPSLRLPSPGERESVISHAKKGRPQSEHFFVPMNAFGFANWYQRNTPIEPRFATDFARRYYDAAGLSLRAAAEVDDIPEQTPHVVKNTATLALQLLKRYRNLQYANERGRIPPSILLTYYAGMNAYPGLTLSDMLIRQCRAIVLDIRNAVSRRQLVRVCNPEFQPDVLTDRWPENAEQQDDWQQRVANLTNALTGLKASGKSLEEAAAVLRTLFGDQVVSCGFKTFNDRTGRAVQAAAQRHTRTGGLYVPSAPAIVTGVAANFAASAARSHTFEGGSLE